MNIVIVSDFANPSGGAAKVAVESALLLAKRGLSVHLFAGTGRADPRLIEAAIHTEAGSALPFNQRPSREGAREGIFSVSEQARFRAFVKDLPARDTIVHVHGHRDVLSSSVIQESVGRFPTIFSCHDYALACPYGCFYDFQKQRLCGKRAMSLGCLTTHCNRKTFAHKIWAVLRQSKQASAGLPSKLSGVVFVSAFSRDILAPYAHGVRHWVLPNPIESNADSPRAVRPESRFLVVGALTVGKGVLVAAEAAKLAGLPITFVGDGEDRDAIVATNSEAEMLGRLDREILERVLRTARAIVFPALWLETQGMAVLEALSHGVPAIVSRQSAAAEPIIDGENGLLVDANDPQGLARAMSTLMDDRLANVMGHAAFDRYWKDPFTPERHADGLLEIYHTVLTEAP